MHHTIRVRSALTGLLTAALTAATLTAAAPASQAATTDPTSSAAAYKSWLADKINAGDTNALHVYNGFSALSADKQTKFLAYLKDPSVTQKFVSFLNGATDNTGVDPNYDATTGGVGIDNPPSPFVNGDVSDIGVGAAGTELASIPDKGGDITYGASAGMTTPSGISMPIKQSAQAADWNAWYKVNDTMFGVKITEVKIWVNYHSNTKRATKVYSAGASHYNYVPFSTFSHSPVSKWISAAGNATAETTWTGKLEVVDTEWSATEHLWADETGFRGGWLR
ncbi:hypothetical protein ABZ527_13750 [Streptomyces griseofuscus]|uniref:hypothetical protein n=1 Tax=Streptomyces griseofuscus TaxID=146922 RepID=UPI0033E0F240